MYGVAPHFFRLSCGLIVMFSRCVAEPGFLGAMRGFRSLGKLRGPVLDGVEGFQRLNLGSSM